MNVYRMIDANLNRLGEGLRVVEDVFRFVYNDESIFKTIKTLRHKARSLSEGIENELIRTRESEVDVGEKTLGLSEMSREDIKVIIRANFVRAEESARVLEESFKMISAQKSETSKYIRFRIYSLEKDVFLAFENHFSSD